MKKLTLLLAFGFVAMAQVPAPTINLPAGWAGAYGGWDGKFGGGAAYATLVSAKAQLYAYWDYKASITQKQPFTMNNATQTGLAMIMRHLGPITILGFFQGGQINNGTNVTGVLSGGGIGHIKLGKTNWTIELVVQPSTSGLAGQQQTYKIGFGREWY